MTVGDSSPLHADALALKARHAALLGRERPVPSAAQQAAADALDAARARLQGHGHAVSQGQASLFDTSGH